MVNESGRTKNIIHAPTQDGIPFYHRDPIKIGTCRIGSVMGYRDALVLLTEKAFINSDFYHKSKRLTKEEVVEIEAYLEGKSNDNKFGLKASIPNTVRTFYKLYQEKIKTLAMRGKFSEYSSYSYIGTEDGVMIMDGRLPDAYDHQARAWYLDGMRHKGDLTLTLPFIGAASKKWLLTLAKALFAAETPGMGYLPRQVLGVAGVSILPHQMLYHLTRAYPQCVQNDTYTCMIINDNGRIVMHTDLMKSAKFKDPIALKNFAGKHITEKEYDVARILIQKGVMESGKCLNSQTTKYQLFWKIDMAAYQNNLKVSRSGLTFQMVKVKETNVFIIIKRASHSGGTRCACNENQDASKTPVCSLNDPCECPCHYETLVPDNHGDAPLPCSLDQPKVNFSDIIEDQKKTAQSLDPCHDPECENKPSWMSCEGTFTCSWCNDKCEPSEECQIPVSNSTEESSVKNGTDGKEIFISVPVSLVILVIIALVIKRLWLSRRQYERFQKSEVEIHSVSGSSAYESIRSNDVIFYSTPPPLPESSIIGQTADSRILAKRWSSTLANQNFKTPILGGFTRQNSDPLHTISHDYSQH